jgi:predicted dehydrogenase
MAEAVRIGVVGCGAISGAYLGMARNFPQVEIHAVADMNLDAARKKAEEFGVKRVMGVEELMKDPAIEIVLNLTVPKAHVPVSLLAIENGKHTYLEKPLGIDRNDARKLLTAAAAKKLRVGCAPDTFMGAGVQTARKLLDEGTIGTPVGFIANMLCGGHETWHPSPEFYYEVGGGPMFDMGPYYLTALLNLLGPVKRLSGIASIAIPERTITSQPKHGKKVKVETPDHIVGAVEFDNGCAGTIQTSFAVRKSWQYDGGSPITIMGTDGALRVPDPNGFDGTVHFIRAGDKDWTEAPHTFMKGYGRSVGLADMAVAIRSGRPHRCSAEQAMTVLDLMQGFLDSSASGKAHAPGQKYSRPAPMPAHLPFGQLD